jgi:hypothetical protein
MVRVASATVRRRGRGTAFAAGAVVVAITAGWGAVGAGAFSGKAVPRQAAAVDSASAAAAIAPPEPVRVAVVGDSLIATTTHEQQAELARRGYDATVEGNPGKPLTDPWTQARLGETDGAAIVVIATASNDNVQLAQRAAEVGGAQASAEYGRALSSTLDRLRAPCTVIVDVREQSSAIYRPATASATNATLRAVSLASGHPTVVVPWSVHSAGHDHTDWFADDELHFITGSQRQDAGVEAYSRAIADGVDQCKNLLVS